MLTGASHKMGVRSDMCGADWLGAVVGQGSFDPLQIQIAVPMILGAKSSRKQSAGRMPKRRRTMAGESAEDTN